ncbi:MAG: lytic transglycosylase domain-containing protein [Fimbriimonas sp.]
MALGIDGVRNRMAELQARLDGLSPKRAESERLPPPPPGELSFSDALEAAQNPLAGPIGKGGSTLRPLNPFSLGITPTHSEGELRSMATEAAQRHGLDPQLFEALVEQESAFNPTARSKVGALGLTQLMPRTAESLGVTDPTDPYQNLNGGARYLADMMKQFDGDPRLALAAYNAGPGAVTRHGGIPPYAETRNYVDRIMTKRGRMP